MPANEEDLIPPTCVYRCDGAKWVLIGGTAPPGYFCPEILGGCNQFDDIVDVDPIPIDPIPDPIPIDPIPDPLSFPGVAVVSSQQTSLVNAGEYQFHPATETLYFSNGNAKNGFRLLAKISVSELREVFPAIAAEVDLLKNARSLASFTVILPAVPIRNQL